jgi:hypothetical protein
MDAEVGCHMFQRRDAMSKPALLSDGVHESFFENVRIN